MILINKRTAPGAVIEELESIFNRKHFIRIC